MMRDTAFARRFARPQLWRMSKALVALVLLGAAGCRDPRAEANIAQAMIDVGTQLSAIQQDYAILQAQFDSLREVVARQDTTVSRLASHIGLPLQR